LIAIGVAEFMAAMIAVQLAYPGYSDSANYISDLGNTATSPWHWVFNLSIILFGILACVGILLAWSGFPAGATRAVGLALLFVASVGAIGVGIFPENVNPTVHDIVSLMVFLPGGVALLVLGIGLRRGTGWHWLRGVSVLLGGVTLVALAYYVPTQLNNSTWDPGLVERVIVAPILLWGALAAAQLARRPRPAIPGSLAAE
jgi:hypothetical membrane protein